MPEVQCLRAARATGFFSRRQLLPFARGLSSPERDEPAGDDWIRVSRDAMACRFEAILHPGEGEGAVAAGRYLDEVDRLEAILSIFRPASEISRLNRDGAGRVGKELFELLQICERLREETEGAFDVTAGALSRCWGFEERRPMMPTAEALAQARRAVGFHHVSLGEDRTVRFAAPGVRLNLGGIGKGYALDRGAEALRNRGVRNALLSAGSSSLLALGDGPRGEGWLVGLRHPARKEERLGAVRLRGCALATSGREEQNFEADGRIYGHILDPRGGSDGSGGYPAQGVASVTVIADSATRADALATAFFVAGPALAERYCAAHPEVMAIMLLERELSRPVTIGSNSGASLELAYE